MLKYMLIALAVANFGKCSHEDEFEGYIKYVVNVETFQEGHPWNTYLSAKWGDTMIIYHSLQGQQRREYINSAPTGFEWSIYDPDKNEYYSKWHTMDTVFYYNCGSSYTNLNYLDVDSAKTINNQTYPSVKMILENPGNGELTEQKFFYDESLKIDANLYADFKDNFLDQLYNLTKSHIIEWSQEEEGVYKVTFTALEISREKLSPDLFELPDGLPYKEF